jgi:hypothetical protein
LAIPETGLFIVLAVSHGDDDDDDVFLFVLAETKTGAELHIYLKEGTYQKRLFRGPSTNDIKK